MADPPVLLSRPPLSVVVPVFVVLAAIGGQLPPFSPEATLYVLTLGGVLTWLGLSRRVVRTYCCHSDDRYAQSAWWLLPILVAAPMEATNYLLGSTHQHPTISILLDPLFAGEPARTALYLGWLAGFWALVRR